MQWIATSPSRSYPLLALFAVLAVGHGAFAWINRDRKPDLSIIDPPPSALERKALALGDDEFLYRAYVMELQNTGDTGGRATPMGQYNYDYVVGWLKALQALDPHAHHHVMLATRYFSWVHQPDAVRKLVDFIAADVETDPARKWYWLTQAIVMANYRLGDKAYALQLAQRLAAYDLPDMPAWVFLFPGVILGQMGRNDEARQLVESVKHDKASILRPEDLHWIGDFESHLAQGQPEPGLPSGIK